MSAELNKCYELLGVKPGVSVAELKAAYRDMAKVWHPDRFGHDERLQKKAQEKLKEINDAYEQLISGKTPRPRAESPRREAPKTPPDFDWSTRAATPVKKSSSIPWQWAVVPLLIFGVVFFLASRTLLHQREQPVVETSEQQRPANESERSMVESTQPGIEQRNRNRSENESPRAQKENESTQSSPSSAVPVQPMAMVTVLIDPSTGLLAKADCPTKTRMTYQAGNEPHGYCNVAHSGKTQTQAEAAQSDSRVKSLAKRVVTPTKWLSSGGKEKSDADRQD